MSAPTTTRHFPDAMTPSELLAACQALSAAIGPRASVSVLSGDYHKGEPARLIVYPDQGGADRWDCKHFAGQTYAQVFGDAHAWAVTHATVHRNARIRAMALAIIELSDELGRCTVADLTRRNFTTAEVADLHETACQRAAEMCRNAPFEVIGADALVGSA